MENKLYSKAQVFVAAFLGSPIAAGILIALNFRTLGKSVDARKAVIVTMIATVVVLAIAFVLPEKFPKIILPLAYISWIQSWYQVSMEHAFKQHIENGGLKGSWWITFAVGIASLVVVFATAIAIAFILPESLFTSFNVHSASAMDVG